MKKLTSLFLGCLMITCAFTSCGDKDDDDSGKSDKKKDTNPIVGTWEGDIDGDPGRYIFSEDGKFTMSMEWSEYLAMEDGKCLVGGSDVTEYLDFDGSDFILSDEGTDIIKMKKTEKTDEDDFDGEYDVEGGYLADVLDEQFGEGESFDISITFDGNETFFNVKDIADYKVDGDKITLSNIPESFSDNGESTEEMDFEIDGDSLNITDSNGEVLELTRVK